MRSCPDTDIDPYRNVWKRRILYKSERKITGEQNWTVCNGSNYSHILKQRPFAVFLAEGVVPRVGVDKLAIVGSNRKIVGVPN